MPDEAVLLTPILVLGALLLLGFAGCGFEGRLGALLAIRVRVPTTLTVTQIQYRTVNPNGQSDQFTDPNPVPVATEGANNVFRSERASVVNGSWTVACGVTVSRNGTTDQDAAQENVILDGSLANPAVTFQVLTTPTGGIDVTFFGLGEEA